MSAVARRREVDVGEIDLVPMRRRHLRAVLRIEGLVYPRPWSASLFLQEIARRGDRVYLVARTGGEVVGYGGLMTAGAEAHITTIAVDPDFQRRRIGIKIMLALMEAAIERGSDAVSLEVRKSNTPAQRLYEKFEFRPVGVRRGYYVETAEDAIVMWTDRISTPEYAELLDGLQREASLDG